MDAVGDAGEVQASEQDGVVYEGGQSTSPSEGTSGLHSVVKMDDVRLEPTEIDGGGISKHVMAVEVEHPMSGTGWELLDLARREMPLWKGPQRRVGRRGWWYSGPPPRSKPAGLVATGPGATPAGRRRTATPPPRLAGTPCLAPMDETKTVTGGLRRFIRGAQGGHVPLYWMN
eukprot:CAMPEP_0194349834 /NCGR_PEP_ID=MMETSP0171-20130528/107309_1 /TAXON_ID=218684 /ORGANISM="Corethron pennatum, Strain L29A3" /LENGTH=172 /DNA_ID=CAMNT_0039117331 /DNA_START=566 /DNA_END=1085 /DNA_ORIENTATION=+